MSNIQKELVASIPEEVRKRLGINKYLDNPEQREAVRNAFKNGNTNMIYTDTDSIHIVSKDNTFCMYDLVGEGYGHIQPNVDDDLF